MKMLVADDDPTTRQILTNILTSMGHEVFPAEDGCEAMTALRKPDAPIMALLDLLGRRWTLRILWELRHEPLSFGDRKRPQQNAVDDGKYGCIGTDTHGQREDDRCGKAAILPEHTCAILQIMNKPVHGNQLR